MFSQSQLFVHNSEKKGADDGRIPVTLDISVFKIKCKCTLTKFIYLLILYLILDLGLDIQDDLGRHEVGFIADTLKTDINNDEGTRALVDFFFNFYKRLSHEGLF